MKLTVVERIVLQTLLPQKGNELTLKLVRKLREALSFSEQEIEAIGLRNFWKCPKCTKVELAINAIKCPNPDCDVYMLPAGQCSWDEKKGEKVIKDIHMGKAMLGLCESVLKKLNNEEALTEELMSLYAKFVSDGEE